MYPPLHYSRVKLSQGHIFWREMGDGPNLIFLHGSWNDSSQWVPIMERLSSDYHCFAPDLLGCGESVSNPKVHHSIAVAVECLAEYIKALKLKHVYLVGHSLGGWIAASYALKYPEQVLGLVLFSPEGVQLETPKQRWFWMRALIAQPPLWTWFLKFINPLAVIFGQGKKVRKSLEMRKVLLSSKTACEFLFKRRWAECQAELLNERLSWLETPTLILQGDEDEPISSALSQTYAALLPKVRLEMINSGRNLPQDAPDAVAELLREFVPLPPVPVAPVPVVWE